MALRLRLRGPRKSRRCVTQPISTKLGRSVQPTCLDMSPKFRRDRLGGSGRSAAGKRKIGWGGADIGPSARRDGPVTESIVTKLGRIV